MSWYSKRIKYPLVFYSWIYDLCKTTGYFHEVDFAFKAATETVQIDPGAAVL